MHRINAQSYLPLEKFVVEPEGKPYAVSNARRNAYWTSPSSEGPAQWPPWTRHDSVLQQIIDLDPSFGQSPLVLNCPDLTQTVIPTTSYPPPGDGQGRLPVKPSPARPSAFQAASKEDSPRNNARRKSHRYRSHLNGQHKKKTEQVTRVIGGRVIKDTGPVSTRTRSHQITVFFQVP